MIDAFVIRLAGLESSESLAQECKNSGSSFGVIIKDFDGIYGETQIEKYHKIYNIHPWKTKMKKHRLGIKGCFLSHYSLWLHCINVNKPIAIFEHDAVMLRPMPNDILNSFNEFLMLDPYNKMKKDYKLFHQDESKKGIEEYFNYDVTPKYGVMSQYVMGLQAYIIKPQAAIKLISYVKINGYYPADIQCNKGIIDIQTMYPSIASINPKFWDNKKLMKEESTTQKKW